MKQAQSTPMQAQRLKLAQCFYRYKESASASGNPVYPIHPFTQQEVQQPSTSNRRGQLFVVRLGVIWSTTKLPFHLLTSALSLVGRITVLIAGFSLMVFGMALWAGPFFGVGIPLFAFGLTVTLGCLR
jgi:hypothetical protein